MTAPSKLYGQSVGPRWPGATTCVQLSRSARGSPAIRENRQQPRPAARLGSRCSAAVAGTQDRRALGWVPKLGTVSRKPSARTLTPTPRAQPLLLTAGSSGGAGRRAPPPDGATVLENQNCLARRFRRRAAPGRVGAAALGTASMCCTTPVSPPVPASGFGGPARAKSCCAKFRGEVQGRSGSLLVPPSTMPRASPGSAAARQAPPRAASAQGQEQAYDRRLAAVRMLLAVVAARPTRRRTEYRASWILEAEEAAAPLLEARIRRHPCPASSTAEAAPCAEPQQRSSAGLRSGRASRRVVPPGRS